MVSHKEHREYGAKRNRAESLSENFCESVKVFRQHYLSLSVAPVSSSEPCKRVRAIWNHAGFSLIEVLVAMTVLIVLVVMVTNMFRNTSEAWDIGTQRAEMNTAARAAVDFMARELSCAVAGSMPDASGGTATPKPFILENGNELRFTAFPANEEVLHGVRIRYDNHIIETTYEAGSYVSGWGGWSNAFLLITNVWRFTVTVSSNKDDMMIGGVGYAYDSSVPANGNLLPACVDISIEMLGEKDMARALNLQAGGIDPTGFVMTNSRVYTTRVCFPNRSGGK